MTEGTENRQQDPIEHLLREAMPRVEENPEPAQDLWPRMRQRLNQRATPAARLASVPWFDWALACGLAVFAVAAPAAVPVLLYYL